MFYKHYINLHRKKSQALAKPQFVCTVLLMIKLLDLHHTYLYFVQMLTPKKDTKHFCILWLMNVLSVSLVGCYQDGAREESCYNMLVIHPNASAQSCPNPCDVQLHLRARVEGGTPSGSVDLTSYECGALYECM